MRTTIGIDIGGSATKIVCIRETDGGRELLSPMFVRATDPLTSVYGAFGRYLSSHNLSLADIDTVKVTGVGSTHLGDEIYSLPCLKVAEFDALGLGGLQLSGLDKAIVVSMGTGTAIVLAERGKNTQYLGGTGVGGGTMRGLSRLLLQMDSLDHVADLAEQGDLSKIDLRISDMMVGDSMPPDLTAANFGNVSDLATKEDISLAIVNMVCETVGMLALFAARANDVKDIVLTGRMSALPVAKRLFARFAEIFGVNMIIPDNSAFGTVIGAALTEIE